ncbi:TrkH family potassium uptake protein [Roseinatronobacter alkalisoli]|uniref:Trk system potassium uptake protein n=1 Tax=Roseinatronobacter alkalisoli TaxID=3028235 RepID=A0ABT5TAN2_9RHOB|nr:TrkH family potassium uptake protein [Roseinatronobacter sp. HJB301]MDD7971780.1 TrkH family potassium uptake protein [Roseinatronobacter sp. HJB301]
MLDIRPVIHLVGLLTFALGAIMLLPLAVDWQAGHDNWKGFAQASFLTCLIGATATLSTRSALDQGLGRRQSFLMTGSVWAVLPAFGALPFLLGAPQADVTHAYFEAMSGMTTTGTTVFVGLDDMPPGVLLWRSILQWLGGLGIIIVALVFLPVLRVGGMQHFQSEAFDTMGKVMPRVYDISAALLQVYLGLTLLAVMAYMGFGMSGFDALNHGLTTIATGGFSTRDASFAAFVGPLEYVGALFMVLAGLPFIRLIQLMGGSVQAIWQDVQIRAFLRWIVYAVAAVMAYRLAVTDAGVWDVLRGTLFNVITLFTGTGYGSEDVGAWGDFPLLVVMLVGFIGACTASTGCSIKVFRFLVLFEAIKMRMRQLSSPRRVMAIKLGGKRLEQDVINSVIVMFTAFAGIFMILAVALALTGLETRTALTAAWTAICNIGPAFGPEVGETGAVDGFPDRAKWLMILGMYLGRLEVLAVLVLLLPRFWRA